MDEKEEEEIDNKRNERFHYKHDEAENLIPQEKRLFL